MSSIVHQKLTTFTCEWTTSTYNTKSDLFALESDKNCCIGVKYSQRINRYVLYLVTLNRCSSGFEIVDVYFTSLKTASRVPMIKLAAQTGVGFDVFYYEMADWKTPVTCKFWISVAETVDTYRYQLGDTLMATQLWQSANLKNFTDVEFHVDGHIFSAHKAIVAARSPVFQAMFKTDMAESSLNQVIIQDVDALVFENFLYFLYTGRVKTSLAEQLFVVADKYQVDTLKHVCQPPPHDVDASDVASLILSL